jgi:hypothetical protein
VAFHLKKKNFFNINNYTFQIYGSRLRFDEKCVKFMNYGQKYWLVGSGAIIL